MDIRCPLLVIIAAFASMCQNDFSWVGKVLSIAKAHRSQGTLGSYRIPGFCSWCLPGVPFAG